MLRTFANTAAGLAGLEILPKWRIPGLPYVRRLRELFAHCAITSVIDVGANKGQFRDLLRNEAGFSGMIHSFEPDPALAALLARRAATDRAWTVFPVALGAAAGTLTLNIMREPAYNSFRAPAAEQTPGHAVNNTVVQTAAVEVRTLDAMAAQFPDLAHTYLKIDTQGFDLEVLKGGGSVARQVPALQTEVAVRPIYDGSPSMQESIAAFAALGFAVADMFLLSADADQRAVEFDCLMVRDPPAA